MAIVTVKKKHQVVIPQSVREQLGVNVGDLLEAKVENGKLIFTPKVLVDRGIAESLEEFKQGLVYGPFTTHRDLVASLHAESKKIRKRSKRSGG